VNPSAEIDLPDKTRWGALLFPKKFITFREYPGAAGGLDQRKPIRRSKAANQEGKKQ
jgi:hypothetical protein